MPIRYCGQARVRVHIRPDKNYVYRCFVRGTAAKWKGDVEMAPWDQTQLAEDSPKAFDRIAHAALSFSCADEPGLMEDLEVNYPPPKGGGLVRPEGRTSPS